MSETGSTTQGISVVKIEIVVCDTCKDPKRPAKTYTVIRDGEEATTDQCGVHGRAFEAPFTHVAADAPAERPRRRSRRASVVKTLEQIEAEKAAGRQ